MTYRNNFLYNRIVHSNIAGDSKCNFAKTKQKKINFLKNKITNTDLIYSL